MTATLPWLHHLSRRELELLVSELVRDLEQRPVSVEKLRAEAGLGCWETVAECYGAAGGDGQAHGGPAAG
jgi:hypothetical protein